MEKLNKYFLFLKENMERQNEENIKYWWKSSGTVSILHRNHDLPARIADNFFHWSINGNMIRNCYLQILPAIIDKSGTKYYSLYNFSDKMFQTVRNDGARY